MLLVRKHPHIGLVCLLVGVGVQVGAVAGRLPCHGAAHHAVAAVALSAIALDGARRAHVAARIAAAQQPMGRQRQLQRGSLAGRAGPRQLHAGPCHAPQLAPFGITRSSRTCSRLSAGRRSIQDSRRRRRRKPRHLRSEGQGRGRAEVRASPRCQVPLKRAAGANHTVPGLCAHLLHRTGTRRRSSLHRLRTLSRSSHSCCSMRRWGRGRQYQCHELHRSHRLRGSSWHAASPLPSSPSLTHLAGS